MNTRFNDSVRIELDQASHHVERPGPHRARPHGGHRPVAVWLVTSITGAGRGAHIAALGAAMGIGALLTLGSYAATIH